VPRSFRNYASTTNRKRPADAGGASCAVGQRFAHCSLRIESQTRRPLFARIHHRQDRDGKIDVDRNAEQDFPDILRYDVLASGSSALDSKRFQPLNFTFPYEPIDPVPTLTFTLTNGSNSTIGSKVTEDFTVGATFEGGADFLGLAQAKTKDTATWAWTHTSSQSTSTGATQAATVTIGGPSLGYTGPVDVAVYFDTLYKTFAFRFLDGPLLALGPPTSGLSGTYLDARGNPMPPLSEVSLTIRGTKYRTLTRTGGQWKFYGVFNGPCDLRTDLVTKILLECDTRESIVLRP
jgi:hypothetical protein